LRTTPSVRHLEFGPILEVRLDRVAEDAKAKLARFETWKRARVVADGRVLGGEPTFPKSRLGVGHLGGMLLRGARPEVGPRGAYRATIGP
jgi:hypothetical protein